MTERITLPGLQTRQVLAMIEHLDDVIRELSLIAAGARSGTAGATVPDHFLTTMDRVRPILYAQKESISRQADRAWRAGEQTLDVAVELPVSAAATIVEVLEVFEAVDESAVGDGAMLLPASSPEISEFRRWFFTRLADDLRRH
jgi:hypothetical protein